MSVLTRALLFSLSRLELTQAATSYELYARAMCLLYGEDGTRTHDFWYHKPAL